jgi:hypothetical protein
MSPNICCSLPAAVGGRWIEYLGEERADYLSKVQPWKVQCQSLCGLQRKQGSCVEAAVNLVPKALKPEMLQVAEKLEKLEQSNPQQHVAAAAAGC